VLATDKTGFFEKGAHSAGLGGQYSGAAGLIEDCQISDIAGLPAVVLRQLKRPSGLYADGLGGGPRAWGRTHVLVVVAFLTKRVIAHEKLAACESRSRLHLGPRYHWQRAHRFTTAIRHRIR